jgi:WhiB family transcriptional regulator, redox-sensing transcriptional regulator
LFSRIFPELFLTQTERTMHATYESRSTFQPQQQQQHTQKYQHVVPDKESRTMNLNEALLTSVDRELVARGRCADGAGTMASLFFSEELHEIAQAKAICTNCPVTDRCLNGALIRREPWGVWGGELVMNGKVLAARRRRGRPPKIKVSELMVDELGCVISA